MTIASNLPVAPSETASPSSAPRVQLILAGHLTEAALAVGLDRADQEIRAAKCRAALIVNCLTMTSYDSAARALFVSWNSRHKSSFLCVAVITKNMLWHMVISSMSLASGQKMKPFNDLTDAEPWILELWSRQGKSN